MTKYTICKSLDPQQLIELVNGYIYQKGGSL